MTSEEEVLYDANPSMFRNHPVLFLMAIPLVLPAFIWWLYCKSTRITITTRHVKLRKGILSKSETMLRIEDIRKVKLEQNLLHRLMGVGTLQMATAGTGTIELEVSGIPHPGHARDLINRHRD